MTNIRNAFHAPKLIASFVFLKLIGCRSGGLHRGSNGQATMAEPTHDGGQSSVEATVKKGHGNCKGTHSALIIEIDDRNRIIG